MASKNRRLLDNKKTLWALSQAFHCRPSDFLLGSQKALNVDWEVFAACAPRNPKKP
jgi:hypothetical protein